MPRSLLAGLLGSVAIHLVALFLPHIGLPTKPEALPPLRAEINPLPRLPTASKPPKLKAPPSPSLGRSRPPMPRGMPVKTPVPPAEPELLARAEPEAAPSLPERHPERVQSSRGTIRFAVLHGEQKQEVGRAIHEWSFEGENYVIKFVSETTGLFALIKPVTLRMESRGKLVAGGLQPDVFERQDSGKAVKTTRFDWVARELTLDNGGKRQDLAPGSQDFLSFYYQLAYLPQLADGFRMGVATERKFETYRFEALGEEVLELPAGNFRTLHLRVQLDSTTELWLALDRHKLPVKIRHTDRKGESFEQIAVELGTQEP